MNLLIAILILIFILPTFCAYIYQYQCRVNAHIRQNDRMYFMIEDIWMKNNSLIQQPF